MLRVVASTAGAILLIACSASEHHEPPELGATPASGAWELEGEDAPLVDLSLPPAEAGRILYEKLECAGCHESAAVPGLVIVPLRDLDARFSDDNLAAFLSAPPQPMPDFGLSEPERHALAVHLRATFQ